VLGVSKEENLRMIRDSIAYLTSLGRRVFFDAEHFFDGFMTDPDYAMATLEEAAGAGVELLVLCDTNGGALPRDICSTVKRVTGAFKLPVAIHCHNDAGLATAGTLCAVSAGASQVQGTMNGYGERCGNANLCEVIPNLMLKLGFDALNGKPLANLTPAARYISEIANAALNPRAPYVGRSAFAHKGGMHIDAMLKDDRTFEHISPELVGNDRRYLISEMAGRGALAAKLNALVPDITKDSDEAAKLTEMLKALESDGYTFEDAESSLELRILGALGRRASFFDVTDFHVLSHLADGEDSARAYVKVRVDGMDEITADQGNGPIAALDKALRKALSRFFPDLNRMRLSDFKVRVVGGSGTSSKVRVHIESTDESETWATVGVSGNILEASFIALTDSIEYMLIKNSRHARP
jgi:2-isopropylmalate synthase